MRKLLTLSHHNIQYWCKASVSEHILLCNTTKQMSSICKIWPSCFCVFRFCSALETAGPRAHSSAPNSTYVNGGYIKRKGREKYV